MKNRVIAFFVVCGLFGVTNIAFGAEVAPLGKPSQEMVVLGEIFKTFDLEAKTSRPGLGLNGTLNVESKELSEIQETQSWMSFNNLSVPSGAKTIGNNPALVWEVSDNKKVVIMYQLPSDQADGNQNKKGFFILPFSSLKRAETRFKKEYQDSYGFIRIMSNSGKV